MVFAWFETFWLDLVAYKKKNRIPSGLMLYGLPGIGKAALGRHFAKLVLCSNNLDQPCTECRSCTLFAVGNHPDFYDLSPSDEGGVIKIDQVRGLVNDLVKTPSLSRYQVALVNKAEDLNRSAANALLKNLEEPSGQVLMLLLSEQVSAVPATVRSRCQMIRCPTPSRLQAEQYVRAASAAAVAALPMTDYLPLKAISYGELANLRDQLLANLEQISQGQLDPSIAAGSYVDHPRELVELFISFIVDMVKIHHVVSDINHHDKISELTRLSQRKTVLQLHEFLDRLVAAMRSIKARSNANLQLLIETLFIHWRYQHGVS